jgi:hypothetical protein
VINISKEIYNPMYEASKKRKEKVFDSMYKRYDENKDIWEIKRSEINKNIGVICPNCGKTWFINPSNYSNPKGETLLYYCWDVIRQEGCKAEIYPI